jgi:hypothetical protein
VRVLTDDSSKAGLMFKAQIHKLDKTTAGGPNCGASTLFSDGLYISRGFATHVYRLPELKKRQKVENRPRKMAQTDPISEKSPKNRKIPPVFLALSRLLLISRTRTITVHSATPTTSNTCHWQLHVKLGTKGALEFYPPPHSLV